MAVDCIGTDVISRLLAIAHAPQIAADHIAADDNRLISGAAIIVDLDIAPDRIADGNGNFSSNIARRIVADRQIAADRRGGDLRGAVVHKPDIATDLGTIQLAKITVVFA